MTSTFIPVNYNNILSYSYIIEIKMISQQQQNVLLSNLYVLSFCR